MDRISCPYCGESIASTARKCRFCGEWIELPRENTAETSPASQSEAIEPESEQISLSNDDGFFNTYFIGCFLKQYADFSGTVSRKTFWLTILAYLIINVGIVGLSALSVALCGLKMIAPAYGITALFSLGTLVPTLALYCRRLRDVGKSPWYILLGLIPFIGPIILLVFFCSKSNTETTCQRANFSTIDWFISMSCALVLIAGICMLIKTLSSLNESLYDPYNQEIYEETEIYDSDDSHYYSSDRTGVDLSSNSDSDDKLSAYQYFTKYVSSCKTSNDYCNFNGYFIANEHSYPITLKFQLDENGKPLTCLYHNVNYNADTKMNVEFDEGLMSIVGKANGQDFTMTFQPESNGEWTGNAVCGNSVLGAHISPVIL